MPPSDAPTPIQACLNRLAAGDPAAEGELIQVSRDRLLELTRRLLRRYPAVRRWAETDDVLQNALLRLCRALAEIPVARTAEFLALAATNIRRELLDLARHYFGPLGIGANHETPGVRGTDPLALAVSPPTEPADLTEWKEIQLQLDRLPADEREVVYLRVYLGMTHAETSATLGVPERTVKRRYLAARLRLRGIFRADSDPEDYSGPDHSTLSLPQ